MRRWLSPALLALGGLALLGLGVHFALTPPPALPSNLVWVEAKVATMQEGIPGSSPARTLGVAVGVERFAEVPVDWATFHRVQVGDPIRLVYRQEDPNRTLELPPELPSPDRDRVPAFILSALVFFLAALFLLGTR